MPIRGKRVTFFHRGFSIVSVWFYLPRGNGLDPLPAGDPLSELKTQGGTITGAATIGHPPQPRRRVARGNYHYHDDE